MRRAVGMGRRAVACIAAALALAACGDPPPPVTPPPSPVPPKLAGLPDLALAGTPFIAEAGLWKESAWKAEPDSSLPDAGPWRTVLTAVESTTAPAERPPLRVLVRVTPQYDALDGGVGRDCRWPFMNWGKSVAVADVDELARGFYEDWIWGSVDVIKDRCRTARGHGNADRFSFGGRAVATEAKSRQRQYRAWFGWSRKAAVRETYIAEFVATLRRVEDDSAWDAAAFDFIRSIHTVPRPGPR